MSKRREPKRFEIRAFSVWDNEMRFAIKLINLFGFKAVIENGKTPEGKAAFVIYAEEVRKV